jgi:hypothetical protein
VAVSASATGPRAASPFADRLGWGLALFLASLGLAGSLFLSLGLGLKACPLCFYQRTFMMSIVAVLLLGWFLGMRQAVLFAWPLALAGLGVALYHVALEGRGRLECPAGILGLGTAPQQSLGIYLLLSGVLLAAGWQASPPHRGALLGSGLVLGVLLTAASLSANPPPPPPPQHPYSQPPDICRPPFVPPAPP